MASWTCRCLQNHRDARLIVITGAPGSGKTAVLELIRHHFCEHVVVLPDAAHIVRRSKFPQRSSPAGRRALARAIFRVQRELERMAIEEDDAALIVCDRGTVDGAAYWPSAPDSFFAENETSREAELARYGAVIELRIPPARTGYDPTDAAHLADTREAAAIDAAILSLWKDHPRRFVIEGGGDFLEKAGRVVGLVHELLPACCRPRRPSVPPPHHRGRWQRGPRADGATPGRLRRRSGDRTGSGRGSAPRLLRDRARRLRDGSTAPPSGPRRRRAPRLRC